MCEHYQTGGIFWVGGIVGAVIASAAADALAKSRTSGTVLAGHVRYEWLEGAAATSDKILLGLRDETLVITYRGSMQALWTVAITLKGGEGIATQTCAELLRRHALFNQEPLSDGRGSAKTPHQLPAINASSTIDSMFCTKCGGKVKKTDAYCKHCGKKL